MLSNKKFSSRSMCVLAETVLLLALLLASGCSKSDDKEVESPDIALNKNELVLEKGKTERLIASFTPGMHLTKDILGVRAYPVLRQSMRREW